MALKKVVSFGFKHDEPPSSPGVLVVDIRQIFRNPYHNRKLRDKVGTDPEVQADVMKTPNFQAKYEYLKQEVTTPGVEEVWIGCMGGRHRSVFLVERLGQELGVPVEHRDLFKP